MNECMLQGYRHKCSWIIDNHHLINRAKLPKGSPARNYCEVIHPEIFIVPVCRSHNSTSKLADTKPARRIIVARLVEIFGIGYVKGTIDGLQEHFKIPYPELRYSAIMAAPLPSNEDDLSEC